MLKRSITIEDMLLAAELGQFFHHEAELLDERRFDEWLTLLDDDIRYWMPVTRNVRRDDRKSEFSREGLDVAWFDEGIVTLRQRVAQINTGIHWAEEPASRTSHFVSNLSVTDQSASEVKTQCRFLVYQNRLEADVSLFAGKRIDTLRRAESGWKVRRREIYLDQSVLMSKALTTFF